MGATPAGLTAPAAGGAQSSPPRGAALDTVREVWTPEGVAIELRPAGPVSRASAWLIDTLLRVGVMLLLAFTVVILGNLGWAILLLTAFFLEWLFPAWCEVYWGGATPGKKALGLVVVHDDGTPVRWPAALTRNLLRFVDFLPLLYVFGLASILASRDFKRLGDHAAGTLVVYRFAPGARRSLPEAPPEAPAAALTLAEQRSLLDYAERLAVLTPERAAELAEIAVPIVGDERGEAAVQRILRVANHVAGRL